MDKDTKAAISAAVAEMADYWEAVRSPRLTEGRNEVEYRFRLWLEAQAGRGVTVGRAREHAMSCLSDTPTRAHLYSRELVERWGEAPATVAETRLDRLDQEAAQLQSQMEEEAASICRAVEQLPLDPLAADEAVQVRARKAWEREVNKWSAATRRRVLESLSPAQRTWVMRPPRRVGGWG